MAAIAIVDVDTGRIEALAGSLSPCTRQEYDGPGRAAQCDRRLPYPIRYRPDALANPALFHDAMPASTIKPIMAAAFLSDPEVGPRWLRAEQAEMARAPASVPSAQSMRAQLMRSDSARFLDRMFCADKGFTACARPWAVQAEALAFGWNADCASAQDDCGRRDLLRGGSVAGARGADPPFALAIPYGRLLAEPLGGKLGAPFRLRAPIALDAGKVRTCAGGPDGARGSRDDWEKCGGGVVVDVVAEGWGQGHARASALGSAGMMATLAAAANGDTVLHRPHVVASLHGVAPAQGSAPDLLPSAATDPNPIARDAAQVILSGLTFGHRAGTSRLACEQVFEPRTCQTIDWIAGKTGTPTFPNDDRTLDELARLCAPGVAKTKAERAACGPLRPYKWYVATYRTDRNGARWTKVIAVLTERNWIAQTGRIHGAGDHGPNPAAEIALQIAGRQAGMLPWDIH
jgi:cell division protein FtsI/penicillin-binding protein 2